jgi:uncharacterized membrane protein
MYSDRDLRSKEDPMSEHNPHDFTCPVCHTERPDSHRVAGEVVRPTIVALIEKEHPDWNHAQPICQTCLNRYRMDYVEDILEEDKGELSSLERGVLASLAQHDLVAEDVNEEFEQQLTLGDRLADKIAEFGGSWAFICLFAGVLALWIIINTAFLVRTPFDPYPFILLNLVLSCIAAIQAPVIMMSQNRQEDRDRLHAEHDYRVNLKAELEIRLLHEKMDLLLTRQWQRLLEIQRIQMDLMGQVVGQQEKRPQR